MKNDSTTTEALADRVPLNRLVRQLDTEGKRLLDAEKAYRDTLEKLQEVCSHEMVAECDYSPSVFSGHASPPRRICETCGTEEEGWGCGYQILTSDRIKRVSREELYAMRKNRPNATDETRSDLTTNHKDQ